MRSLLPATCTMTKPPSSVLLFVVCAFLCWFDHSSFGPMPATCRARRWPPRHPAPHPGSTSHNRTSHRPTNSPSHGTRLSHPHGGHLRLSCPLPLATRGGVRSSHTSVIDRPIPSRQPCSKCTYLRPKPLVQVPLLTNVLLRW
jgi:hypothetical protein